MYNQMRQRQEVGNNGRYDYQLNKRNWVSRIYSDCIAIRQVQDQREFIKSYRKQQQDIRKN